jgi:hypothetical protein
MSRFIAVTHCWHVHDKDFNVHQLESTSLQEARNGACWLKGQREAAFDTCCYVLVEIDHYKSTMPNTCRVVRLGVNTSL